MTPLFSSERLDFYPARAEDIGEIYAIQEDAENAPYVWHDSAARLNELRGEEGIALLAVRRRGESALAGFVLTYYFAKANSLELRRLALRGKGQGLGQELLRALMAYAFETLGVHRLWLDTYTFNERGIHIYEKLGFVREGLERDVYRENGVYLSEYLYSMLEGEYRALPTYRG